jgi:hypothetical protein
MISNFITFRTPSKAIASLFLTAIIGAMPVTTLAEGKGLIAGFRGVTWGDPVAKLGLVDPISQTSECFFRKSEKLTLNEIKLTDIRYCFTNGKLSSVLVSTNSPVKAMRLAIIGAYGQPTLEVAGYVTWGSISEIDGGTAALLSDPKLGSNLILRSNKAAMDEKIQKVIKARKDF